LTGRFGLPIQRTAQSNLDPKMIAWMESRMKKFDKDSNKGLDRGEFKTYDMNGNFEAIDQNKDGLADVYELVFARMKQ
jgi:antitoxin component YwqK of YwqJK toxin-antitoxin module